jgi:NADPH-dependent 2,4-dienoyl-CoA reductase/sulfur reductase-like enzyme
MLSLALVDYFRERGVEVLPDASVTGVRRIDGVTEIALGDGRTLEADAVVAGLGIEPNVQLAADAGLAVANGVVVDVFGRASGRDEVLAAGDVARFPVVALDVETRVEHEDHARSHGRRVGANLAGAAQPYDHLPFFYSDLFEVGYEAVGELDPSLETLVELDDLRGQGVVYYLDGGRRARGVLLWNTFGRVDDARELIRSGEPVTPGTLSKGGS